jgi:hypothetical protein
MLVWEKCSCFCQFGGQGGEESMCITGQQHGIIYFSVGTVWNQVLADGGFPG